MVFALRLLGYWTLVPWRDEQSYGNRPFHTLRNWPKVQLPEAVGPTILYWMRNQAGFGRCGGEAMSENRYEATPDGSKSDDRLGNKPYGKELAQLHVEMVKLEE